MNRHYTHNKKNKYIHTEKRKTERKKGEKERERGRKDGRRKKEKKKARKEGKVKKDKKMGQVLYNECKFLVLELSFGFSGFCCFCF